MERIVSPGVFTNENDQSYLPIGVGAIGAAFIGPTQFGEAFVPTEVTSYDDFTIKFGTSYDASYMPYTVRYYLENAGSATICKILPTAGYIASESLLMVEDGTDKILAVFHETRTTYLTAGFATSTLDGVTVDSIVTSSGTEFALNISSSETTKSFSGSSDPTKANWMGNVIGEGANSTDPVYRYSTFKQYCSAHSGSNVYFDTMDLDFASSTAGIGTTGYDYSEAATPWIQSQLVGGSSVNLFRIHTINHGTEMNRKYKIAITGIKKASEIAGSDWGSFTLVVREYDDKDTSPISLETYTGLSLDPDNVNYIAKKIGDIYYKWDNTNRKLVKHGDFSRKSKYIWVEMDADVKNKAVSTTLIPYGHAAIVQPMLSTATYTLPVATMVTAQERNSEYNSNIYYGFNFNFDTTDNLNYLMPTVNGALAGDNAAFNLDNYSNHASASTNPGSSLSGSLANQESRKFIIPMQGGFDAFNPALEKKMGSLDSNRDMTATNMGGFDLQNANASGYASYKIALDLLSNKDQYDINLLFTPGVLSELHSSVVQKSIDLCESRGDCFYIFDNARLNTLALATVTNEASNYDTSYAATYYPWVKIFDSERNKYLWVPPSVIMSGAYSFSDKVGYEWFAPAGLNRGSISAAKDVFVNLKHSERDTLADGKVNPIMWFPNEGVTVWGQKTLQTKASALDRVNVRRLLINLKKFIASTSRYLVFENNVSATRNSFLAMVNPYMEDIQQKSGLYAFRVQMDSTNNEPDIIDRNMLVGEIWIQPAKTAEFIVIDLNLLPTGASFSS